MRAIASITLILLGFTPLISMSEPSKTQQISTPSGAVETTCEPVEPFPQTVVHAPPGDIAQIDKLALQANRLLSVYQPQATAATLSEFDVAFLNWQRDAKAKFTEGQVINMLGAFLGNKLVKDFDMEWVVVTDMYGTDFAVRGKKVEVMSFPFSSVAKRIESHQFDFMNGVYFAVKNAVENENVKAR